MYKTWIQINDKNGLCCHFVRLIVVPPLISLAEMLLKLVDSVIAIICFYSNPKTLCHAHKSDQKTVSWISSTNHWGQMHPLLQQEEHPYQEPVEQGDWFLMWPFVQLVLNCLCVWRAGTFVHKECDRDQEQGVCLPCEHGQTYTEHSNGMHGCLPCTRCRTGNELEFSSPLKPNSGLL